MKLFSRTGTDAAVATRIAMLFSVFVLALSASFVLSVPSSAGGIERIETLKAGVVELNLLQDDLAFPRDGACVRSVMPSRKKLLQRPTKPASEALNLLRVFNQLLPSLRFNFAALDYSWLLADADKQPAWRSRAPPAAS